MMMGIDDWNSRLDFNKKNLIFNELLSYKLIASLLKAGCSNLW